MSTQTTPWNLITVDWEDIVTVFPALQKQSVVIVNDAISGQELVVLVDNIKQCRPLTEQEAEFYPSALSALYTQAPSNADWALMYIIQSEDFVIQQING